MSPDIQWIYNCIGMYRLYIGQGFDYQSAMPIIYIYTQLYTHIGRIEMKSYHTGIGGNTGKMGIALPKNIKI